MVTAKGSPIAKALSDAVNELIADGGYAKISAKWGVSGSRIMHTPVKPTPGE
jgi:polar amino acid transport system substrate-binding protein